MNRAIRGLLAITLAGMLSFVPAVSPADPSAIITTQAHSGRTDSSGGHRDNRNASGLGSYHYHCGGYPPHLHENGICPYTDSSESQSAGSSGSKSSVSKSTIKKVQKKLNRLGYACGTPDGIMGSKSKKALKQFQKDNDLEADGIIGKQTLKALGLD